jgi:HEAT repeat protein
LQAPGEEVREQAAVALARIGEPAVADLARLLRHEEEAVRSHALTALQQLGARARGARRDIPRALQDHDPQVRYLAVRVLPQLSLEADESVPLLLAAAGDEDCDVSHAGEEELSRLGKVAISPLCRAMKDPHLRPSAVAALCSIEAAPSAADFADMLALLQSEDSAAASAGQAVCQSWLCKTKDAFFQLNRLLFHRDRLVRQRVMSLLSAYPAGDPPPRLDQEIVEAIAGTLDDSHPVDAALKAAASHVTPDAGGVSTLVLARMLRDEDDDIRAEVCLRLGYPGRFGRGSEGLVAKVLQQRLRDRQLWVRLAAAEALTDLGKDPRPQLRDDLKHDRTSLHAATVLLKLDAASREAQAVLQGAMERREGVGRLQAAAALALFREPGDRHLSRSLTILIEALKGKQPADRYFAARTFARMGLKAGPVVPSLLDALPSADPRIRQELLHAIGGAVEGKVLDERALPRTDGSPFPYGLVVRPDARTTLPRLAKLLNDPDAEVRKTLIDVLKTFGGDAAELLALAMKDPENSWHAFDTLFQVREGAKKAVPVLHALLRDPQEAENAAWSLRSIDPVGSFPQILAMLERRDPEVRRALQDAGKVEPQPDKTVSALGRLLADTDPLVRRRAAHALNAITPYAAEGGAPVARVSQIAREMLPAVVTRLGAAEARVWRQAMDELLELRALAGKQSNALVLAEGEMDAKLGDRIKQALEEARDDTDLEVRRKARQATRRYLYPRPAA